MTDIINIIVKNLNNGVEEDERINAQQFVTYTIAFFTFMIVACLVAD